MVEYYKKEIIKDKSNLTTMNFKELYNSTDNRRYTAEATESSQAFTDVAGLKDIADISMKNEILVISSCES